MTDAKTSPAKVVDLRCEFVADPIGIGETTPRLSWRMEDDRNGARQTAYRIVAASTPGKLAKKPDLWDTGVAKGAQSLDVAYAGKALKSRSRVFWKVQVADADGAFTDWSASASFELGLLSARDWKADWIAAEPQFGEIGQPSPYFRKTFQLPAAPVCARLYVSALGLYEAHINGRKVGEDYMTPGWTLSRVRLQAQAYDVTDMLAAGDNAIGGILGGGWYGGCLGWGESSLVMRHEGRIALKAQLEVKCADGSRHVVVTDPSWKTATGPIVFSEIYHGEMYDATKEIEGWDTAAFDASSWKDAEIFTPPEKFTLDPARTLPVRKETELAVVAQTEPQFGVHVFDLGQNMVGWARVKIRAPRGRKIQIRFAEMLNDDGTLYNANYRTARSTDFYVCKGTGEEVFEPHFTFHGFRYVELTNLVEKPVLGDVTGVVIHSAMEKTGEFECSNPLVNRLQQNIQWGQRGNYLEVPTDCPQRDERLGWTGDAQVFIRTGTFNFNVAGFFTKWCRDLIDSQSPKGAFPHVCPNVWDDKTGFAMGEDKYPGGAAAWADAGVVCPWTEYLAYGDKRLLERNFESMSKWIGWQEARSKDGILDNATFGDWLALDIWSLKPRYDRQLTNRQLLSTACFARTTAIMAKAAKVLGKTAEARRFARLLAKIKAAFAREFITPSGRLVSETQTAYLLALAYDLFPEELREQAVGRLVAKFAEYQDHLSTGFVGTPLIGPVLSRFGKTDLAYRILLQKTYPGWLFSVLQGATTMWERWNSYTKEAGFGDVGMNSFNHYAYGAIGQWMYASIAGIELDEADPAFHHVLIKPEPPSEINLSAPADETVTWAEGRLMTRYGLVTSRWEATEDGRLVFNFTIPPNTTATVMLPGLEPYDVPAGSYTVEG